MRNIKFDLTGQRFGRLLVIRRTSPLLVSKRLRTAWICHCDCGKDLTSITEWLRSGHVKSCGCLHLEKNRTNNLRHGHNRIDRKSREYRSWDAMIQRAFNPNHTSWNNYGGRGITVCERWKQFENFLTDMGNRPEGLTLDRINNDGNYEPGNCRWATRKEQCANSRPRQKGYKHKYKRTPEHTAKLLASRRAHHGY